MLLHVTVQTGIEVHREARRWLRALEVETPAIVIHRI